MNIARIISDNFQKHINFDSYNYYFDQTRKISYYALALFQTAISPIYALFDEGLAHLFGLEVLRHGTCLPNYVSILHEGAKPSYGAIGGGVDAYTFFRPFEKHTHIKTHCQNHVYVFKDSEARQQANLNFPGSTQLMLRIAPNLFAMQSGIGYAVRNASKYKFFFALLGSFMGVCTPTLRFKFDKSQVHQVFEDDPDFANMAYRTNQVIPSHRIGIYGTLKHGLNTRIFTRIYENPSLVLQGLVELTTAIVLSLLIIL